MLPRLENWVCANNAEENINNNIKVLFFKAASIVKLIFYQKQDCWNQIQSDKNRHH
jgi:hypothetical protein